MSRYSISIVWGPCRLDRQGPFDDFAQLSLTESFAWRSQYQSETGNGNTERQRTAEPAYNQDQNHDHTFFLSADTLYQYCASSTKRMFRRVTCENIYAKYSNYKTPP